MFVGSQGTEWPGEYFVGDDLWFTHWPTEGVQCRMMFLDPSLGKTERSDMSAIVSLAVTADGTIWVDADIDRRDTARISSDCVDLARRFNPHWIGVEVNGFQELLAGEMARVSKEAGFLLPIYPVVNTVAKITRIRALTPYFSRREFRF